MVQKKFKQMVYAPVGNLAGVRKQGRLQKMYPKQFPAPMVLVPRRRTKTNYVDTAAGDTTGACNTTGTIGLLFTVAQGTGSEQRIGKKINWKSLQMRGSVTADSATTVCTATLLIVYDKRPTGSLPAITDILESVSSRALNNTQNENRFRIVMRRDWNMTGNTNTAGQINSNSNYVLEEFIKLKGCPTVFKEAGTGAIADIEEGAFYYVTVGTVAAGTADANIVFQCRGRFYDTQG